MSLADFFKGAIDWATGAGKLADELAPAAKSLAEGLGVNIDEILLSGKLDDIEKLRDDLVQAADDANNFKLKAYFENPDFIRTLKIESQYVRLGQMQYDAIANGTSLNPNDLRKLFPDIKQETRGNARRFVNDINAGIKQSAEKYGITVEEARSAWLEENAERFTEVRDAWIKENTSAAAESTAKAGSDAVKTEGDSAAKVGDDFTAQQDAAWAKFIRGERTPVDEHNPLYKGLPGDIEVPANAKFRFSDGSNPVDAKFEHNIWASFRGERTPIIEHSPLYNGLSSDVEQAFIELLEKAKKEIHEETIKRAKVSGLDPKDHFVEVNAEWVAKNDPNSPTYDPDFSFIADNNNAAAKAGSDAVKTESDSAAKVGDDFTAQQDALEDYVIGVIRDGGELKNLGDIAKKYPALSGKHFEQMGDYFHAVNKQFDDAVQKAIDEGHIQAGDEAATYEKSMREQWFKDAKEYVQKQRAERDAPENTTTSQSFNNSSGAGAAQGGTRTLNDIEVPANAKFRFSDGSNPVDAKFEYNFWEAFKGNPNAVDINDPMFKDISPEVREAVSDLITRSNIEIEEETMLRSLNSSGVPQQHLYREKFEEVHKDWLAKNDPNSPTYDPDALKNGTFPKSDAAADKTSSVVANSDNPVEDLYHIMSKTGTKIDKEFKEEFWKKLREGEEFDPSKYYSENTKRKNRVSDEVINAADRLMKRMEVEVADEAEKLATVHGGDASDYADEAYNIWVRKVDPEINPNAATYVATPLNYNLELSLRKIFKADGTNEDLINIARDTLSDIDSFDRLIKSPDPDDHRTIQRALIRKANENNSENAIKYFSSDEFLAKLDVLSQTMRMEDDYWKALEDGTKFTAKDLDKYPNIPSEQKKKILDDFAKANEEIQKIAEKCAAPHSADSFARILDLPLINNRTKDGKPQNNILSKWLDEAERTPEQLVEWMNANSNKDADLAVWMSKKSNIDKLTDGLKPRKAEDFIDYARKKYVNENNPTYAKASKLAEDDDIIIDNGKLPEYEPPQAKSKELPAFKPSRIMPFKVRAHITQSDRWILPSPEIYAYPAKAMLPMSERIVDPVLKYVDKAMRDTGIIKKLQDLEEDIFASYRKGATDNAERASKIINDFASDPENLEALKMFRDKVQELRDHVKSTYKTNADRNNGLDYTTWGDDYTEPQEKALLQYLGHMVNFGGDISKGTEGRNGQEILKNLKKIDDGVISKKDFYESITGLSQAFYYANIAEVGLTGNYPKKLGGGMANWQFIKNRTREIQWGGGNYNTAQHESAPISKRFLTAASGDGGDNTEFLFQNRGLEKWLELDENGKAVTPWHNDRTAENFLGSLVPHVKVGSGHIAVLEVKMLSRLKHGIDGGPDIETLPTLSLYDNAIAKLKADHPITGPDADPKNAFYHSEQFDHYFKGEIRRIIEENETSPRGRNNKGLFASFGHRWFGWSRQNEFRATTYSYSNLYSSLFADKNRINIMGKDMGYVGGEPMWDGGKIRFPKFPVPWMDPQSLPGTLDNHAAIRYWIQKPIRWAAGQHQYEPSETTVLGRKYKINYEDPISNYYDKEGGEKPWQAVARGVLRSNSIFTLDRFTKPLSLENVSFEGWRWKKPTTWVEPMGSLITPFGVKPSRFGSYVIVMGGAAGGAYGEISNASYEGMSFGEAAVHAGVDAGVGMIKGMSSNLVVLKDENDNWLPDDISFGIFPKTIGRIAIGGIDLIADDFAGIISDGRVSYDIGGWYDSHVSPWQDDIWGGTYYSSYAKGNDGASVSISPSGSAVGGIKASAPAVAAGNLDEAEDMSEDIVDVAEDNYEATMEGFAALLDSVDAMEQARITDIDEFIRDSKDPKEIKRYSDLKQQLRDSVQSFREQITTDRNKAIAELGAALGTIRHLDDKIQATSSPLKANQLLAKQSDALKSFDKVEPLLTKRSDEIAATDAIFINAISSGSVLDETPMAIDIAAEEARKAREAAEAQRQKELEEARKKAEQERKAQEEAEKKAREEAEKKAREEAEKAEREAKAKLVKSPDGRKALADLAAVRKAVAGINGDVKEAERRFRALEAQEKLVETVKENIKDDSSITNKDERLEKLDKLLVSIKDGQEKVKDKIEMMKAVAESSKAHEVSATTLINEITASADNLGAVSGQIDELNNLVQAAKDDGKAVDDLLGQIDEIVGENIDAIKSNIDITESEDWRAQVRKGGIQWGGEYGAFNQFIAPRADGSDSPIEGIFNVAAGWVKGLGQWWDGIERGTRSQDERNMILAGKMGFVALSLMVAFNTVNDWFFGGKIGGGWKLIIGGAMLAWLFKKSGEWGQDMVNTSYDKGLAISTHDDILRRALGHKAKTEQQREAIENSSRAQTNQKPGEGNAATTHAPAKTTEFTIKKADGSKATHIFVAGKDGMTQAMKDGSLPQNASEVIMSDEMKNAVTKYVGGKCGALNAGDKGSNAIVLVNKAGTEEFPVQVSYSCMADAANDAEYLIRANR